MKRSLPFVKTGFKNVSRVGPIVTVFQHNIGYRKSLDEIAIFLINR
jgi:hypothetical protein